MKISKLFHVLVVTGASTTVGLAACSSSDSGGGTTGGTGGGSAAGTTSSAAGHTATGGGGATATGGGGATATGGGGATAMGGTGGAGMCAAVCMPDVDASSALKWTDCNGCCCWLAAGKTTTHTTMICGDEPCCAGRGRTGTELP
jgi:hypothetical protein